MDLAIKNATNNTFTVKKMLQQDDVFEIINADKIHSTILVICDIIIPYMKSHAYTAIRIVNQCDVTKNKRGTYYWYIDISVAQTVILQLGNITSRYWTIIIVTR